MPPTRRPAASAALLLAVMLAVLGLVGAGPASAATGGGKDAGWVRLAHFSPDTPKVDVYLDSYDRPEDRVVLKGVGYGALSPYQRIEPGLYSVSMRQVGAPASSPALLSTNVSVKAGKSFTVAGVGRNSEITLKVLTDDLAVPPAGKARVRVVQASSNAPVVEVKAQDGPVVAPAAGFATTTDYALVPGGRWALQVTPKSGSVEPVTQSVDLKAGAVYSVLVLDDAEGVQVLARLDSASAGVVPKGSIDTGLGGAAGRELPLVPAAGALVAVLAVAGLNRRRELRTR